MLIACNFVRVCQLQREKYAINQAIDVYLDAFVSMT